MVDGAAGLEDLPERVLRQLDQAETPLPGETRTKRRRVISS